MKTKIKTKTKQSLIAIGIICGLISGIFPIWMLCNPTLRQNIFPFSLGWQAAGKGTVTAIEVEIRKRYYRRSGNYYYEDIYSYRFNWFDPDAQLLRVGTSKAEKNAYHVGQTVEILSYKHNPLILKIQGTDSLSGSFYFICVFILVMEGAIWYAIRKPSKIQTKKKRNNLS